MRLRVRHRIQRRYAARVPRVIELLRLYPTSFEGQIVVDWAIELDHDARLRPARDGYGNGIATLYVEGPTDRIELTVAGEVLTEDRAGQVAGARDPLPSLLFTQSTKLTAITPAVQTLADETATETDALARAHALARLIGSGCTEALPQRFQSATEAVAPATRDLCGTAHLLVAAARAAGYPARVVSGYFCEDERDRGAPHLWSELLVEGFGWIGFDPVHERCPDDRYVRLAVGLDAREAGPLAGSIAPLPARTSEAAR